MLGTQSIPNTENARNGGTPSVHAHRLPAKCKEPQGLCPVAVLRWSTLRMAQLHSLLAISRCEAKDRDGKTLHGPVPCGGCLTTPDTQLHTVRSPGRNRDLGGISIVPYESLDDSDHAASRCIHVRPNPSSHDAARDTEGKRGVVSIHGTSTVAATESRDPGHIVATGQHP